MKEIHILGIFVHGALSAFHLLGVVYNVRRRNYWDIAIHAAGIAYSARSTLHHAKEAERA